MPPTHMLAHHRGAETTHIRRTRNADTHTKQQPEPEPSSNLSHIPTWQTLPGSQSKQSSLAERQGLPWARLQF